MKALDRQRLIEDAHELFEEAKEQEDPMKCFVGCAAAITGLFFVITTILEDELKIGGVFEQTSKTGRNKSQGR